MVSSDGVNMNINIDDKMYNVEVSRKKNKNLYIRVEDNLNINVSCPFLYTNKMIEKILYDNIDSIKNMLLKTIELNNKKLDENSKILGKEITIIYKDVLKPIFSDNTLIVKDVKMKDKWYKNKAYEVFRIYLDEAYYAFDEKIPYPTLKVRNMKTRWGVCNRKNNSITLNFELIKKDHKYLNYVIVHELSHFVHFDHSKDFWETVNKYCPEYKIVRKEMRK